ncbi:uncharacterized protein LOC122078578 [Macadamia integrifolia]|uniref:uncharacterized protein LOC122078578 n=1 Tax=Macadamia integrifolia TaxID=60698 RepID=UPI001C4F1080|nr:uncharacterized protein LOC122078578 [Macadamia integrifolia]
MVGSCLDSKTNTVKFLCSYGGKILPRYPDGKLRYVGGETRVLAVDRSTPFSELLVKLGELCGCPVNLRCQLPTEDLDALVSVTSDEDLANLLEEYDRANMCREKEAKSVSSSPLKIRAFLSLPKSMQKVSPPQSAKSSIDAASASKSSYTAVGSNLPGMDIHRCVHHGASPVGFPVCFEKSAGKHRYYAYHAQGDPKRFSYLIHNGNHWQ